METRHEFNYLGMKIWSLACERAQQAVTLMDSTIQFSKIS